MEGRDLVKVGTPLVAMGTVWAAGKAVTAVYEKVSGGPAPAAEDLNTPMRKALAFAIATSAVSAIVNTVVVRAMTKAAGPAPDQIDPVD